MIQPVLVTCILMILVSVVTMTEPILVNTVTGDQDDLCSIYPSCSNYGDGTHQILENCQKYFECERREDGSFVQRNMECPGNEVFTNNLGKCGDPDLATECKEFQSFKCKEECPRIHFSSTGLSSTTHPESLGCFRLKGSKDLNRVAYYENSHKLTLTPFPTNIWVSWHITGNTKCPYSGRLVNEQDKYVRCPRSNWRGWEVRTGGGLVIDEDIVTRCLSGDGEIETPSSSTVTSTTSSTITTTTSTSITTTTTSTSTTTTITSTSTTTTAESIKGISCLAHENFVTALTSQWQCYSNSQKRSLI